MFKLAVPFPLPVVFVFQNFAVHIKDGEVKRKLLFHLTMVCGSHWF